MQAPKPRPSTEDRIKAALWFAAGGFGVFTVWSADPDGTCRCPLGLDCTNAGKHPIPQRGFHDATTDPARIRTLLAAGSEPNYGLVCPDGIFALDVDGDGIARLIALEAEHGELPPTLRTKTAHGEHVFLRWPDHLPRPIGQLWGFVTRWGAGANAGYVIGPRSVHASGFAYDLATSVVTIAELPDVWAQSVLAPPVAELPDGEYVIPAGGYALPEPGFDSDRYPEIVRYTGSRYMRGLGKDEVWAGVLTVLAPLFAKPLTESELRDRFERAWKNTARRLGPPLDFDGERGGRRKPVAPRSAAEIGASSIDAADLLALDIPPMTWIVPDLIPEGTTVLAGPPKLGKSCLVYQIAVEVALGGELLGRDIDQGDVLYLALEDGKRRGQTRLRAALGERLMPRGRLEVRWAAAKLGSGLEQELIDWLDNHLDARLVAIDTLQRVRGKSDSRRNAYEVDVEDLGRLQDIFKDRTVGLLIVHHSKKDAGDDFLASVSGTYGITGSVDTTLVIQRKRLEVVGKLVVTGRDVAEIEDAVQFNGLTWSSAPRSLAEASFERAEVYKAIEQHGPVFATAIAERIGSTRTAVQRLVEKLVIDGAVVRATGGYVIPPVLSTESPESPLNGEMRSSGDSGDYASRAHTRARITRVAGDSGDSGDYVDIQESPESPPLRVTRARGAESATPGWCHFFADHRFKHRDVQTGKPWCEICTPPKESA